MRNCLVCQQPFTAPAGRGRPPETCSSACAIIRKRQQRAASKKRASQRRCPDHLHGTSTGYTYFQCDCAKCRRWSREYQQGRRAMAAVPKE